MSGLKKYWAFARISAREASSERADLYGRTLFFGVILSVFAALWRAIAEAGMPLPAKSEDMVWYLAATEWILLSAPTKHLELQEQIRRGDFVYWLPRPVSFPRSELARCLGMLAVRAPVLGVVAFGCGYALTGRTPGWSALVIVVPFGLLAAAVLAELYLALGLVAFWLSDATPLYWLTGKLTLILGGLMLPLELYPSWLRAVALATPYSALLSGPASFVLHDQHGEAWLLALRLVAWAFALFLAIELMFRRAIRALSVGGG